MSKSRENKHRKLRANRKLEEWRIQHSRKLTLPVEIVDVKGKLPSVDPAR